MLLKFTAGIFISYENTRFSYLYNHSIENSNLVKISIR